MGARADAPVCTSLADSWLLGLLGRNVGPQERDQESSQGA
jgi:hypothetical protein